MAPKAFQRQNYRDERGSATIVGAAMIVVLLHCTGIGVYLGSAVVARHRAQAAADLAALTAGARLPAGTAAACADATAVAHVMRVDTIHCQAEHLDVIVRVDVATAFAGTAHAAARAGPVDATS